MLTFIGIVFLVVSWVIAYQAGHHAGRIEGWDNGRQYERDEWIWKEENDVFLSDP